jgi:hypothetical protein
VIVGKESWQRVVLKPEVYFLSDKSAAGERRVGMTTKTSHKSAGAPPPSLPISFLNFSFFSSLLSQLRNLFCISCVQHP